jgi:hypothetical protein
MPWLDNAPMVSGSSQIKGKYKARFTVDTCTNWWLRVIRGKATGLRGQGYKDIKFKCKKGSEMKMKIMGFLI